MLTFFYIKCIFPRQKKSPEKGLDVGKLTVFSGVKSPGLLEDRRSYLPAKGSKRKYNANTRQLIPI